MSKFITRIGLLVFFCCSASIGVLAATEHAIPVESAHGASRHDVTVYPLETDIGPMALESLVLLFGLHFKW